MNNQSPLIPQGSLLEQRNKGRARVKIAVFLVLAIHGVGLMALLMQGCKKQPDSTTTDTTTEPTNNPAPAFVEPTNTPAATNLAAAAPTNVMPPAPVEQPQPIPAAPAAANATDYVVVKGDTFSGMAKKFHVSVKALLEANPSVEPTKLKIGQTIHVPAAQAAGVAAGGSGIAAAGDDSTNGGQTYSVKSGDSLSKIAGQFGVSVKALRSANNLKTDKIVVGQKLKIPGKATAATTAPGTTAPATTPTGQ